MKFKSYLTFVYQFLCPRWIFNESDVTVNNCFKCHCFACNFSNMGESVSSHFQMLKRDLKRVFLRNCEVFGNAMKHSLECLIDQN